MRLRSALVVLACVAAAGCGGSGEDATPDVTMPAGGATLEDLWRAPGDDVAVVPGTSSYELGDVRVSFVVVDSAGEPVTLPTARVWLAHGLEKRPFLETQAKLERIGVPGGAETDATHIYVTRFRVGEPGTYWLLAEPEGGPNDVQALGNLVVKKDAGVPDVGEAAPASTTPTLGTAGGRAEMLTTRTPPDVTLLEHSVAEAVHDERPFVVTFATPKFCASRACGPVVDVVEEVARRFEDSPARFIHVEVHEDLNPARGYNAWMREWGLETEPWTFVVDDRGMIAARFEGAVSVHELEASVGEVVGR
jgi:hypothetical protein